MDVLLNVETFDPADIAHHFNYKVVRVRTSLGGHKDPHGLKGKGARIANKPDVTPVTDVTKLLDGLSPNFAGEVFGHLDIRKILGVEYESVSVG